MSVFPPSEHHVVVLSIDDERPFDATSPLSDGSFCRRSTCEVAAMLLGESQG